MKQLFLVALATLAVGLSSCSKSTIVGSDLLDQDQIDLDFTDTLTINAYTVTTDSVRTYDPDFADQLLGYLVGQMDDPVFGQTLAQVYAEIRPGTEEPDFTDAVLDSVVLILPYNASSTYGDSTQVYGMDIHLMDEGMDRENNIFSNKSYPVADQIGISEMFSPNPSDSITILVHGGETGETQRLPAQQRIRLNDDFGNDLMSEPVELFESDSAFLANYPGIRISPNTVNQGINAFDLRSTNFAGIVIYFHVDDDFQSYTFPFSSLSARMTSFEHDYTGSVAENFIDDPEAGDSLLFLQGMAGLTFIVEIPYSEFLAGNVINKAELELTTVTLPEDLFTPFDPVMQVIASEVTDTGLAIIDDVEFGIDRGDLAGLFGGVIDDGTPGKILLNLSAHLRNMSLGQVSEKIQITVLARPEIANRMVIAGPGHSQNPIRLKVNFTNL